MNKILLTEVLSNNNSKIPVWFMRQAGRYMGEYLKERGKHKSFFDMCLDSEAVKKITLQPLERFDIDAAIIFSDILIIPFALGLDINFIKGEGPVFSEKNLEDRIIKLEKEEINKNVYEKVYEGIRKTKEEIDLNFKDKALIGFAGSPFTIMCYIMEGKGSRDFNDVKQYYFNNKKKFVYLQNIIKKETIRYLKGKIDSGVEVIKLFDSWSGVLAEEEFEELVIKPTIEIKEALKEYNKNIIINAFPKGSGVKYKRFVEEVKPDIISIDHTMPKEWVRDNLQHLSVIQGNLDNTILAAENSDMEKIVNDILNVFSKGRFIFNLGHGILPCTNVKKVENLITLIKKYDRK
ncbi:MAG: uroporphyrinogen decarboxylase [Candidatus Midichloriaceae bacterium]|jgi:uroporphyrinogen decarboxylase